MNRFVFAVGLVATIAGAAPAFAVNPVNAGVVPTTAADPGTSVGYKSLMTLPERNALRDKVQTSATIDECKAYLEDWRTKLEARAKEKGVANVRMPKPATCESKRKVDKAARAESAGKTGKSGAAAAPAGSATPAATDAPAKK